jgi:hypothetical protein
MPGILPIKRKIDINKLAYLRERRRLNDAGIADSAVCPRRLRRIVGSIWLVRIKMQAKYLFVGAAVLGLPLSGQAAYAGAGSSGGFIPLTTHASAQVAVPAAFLFGFHGLHALRGLHYGGWGHGWHHYGPWSGGWNHYNYGDHGGWGRYGSWQDGQWHQYQPWGYQGGDRYGAWGDSGWHRYYPYEYGGWRRYSQWNYGGCCGGYPETVPYPSYDYGGYYEDPYGGYRYDDR